MGNNNLDINQLLSVLAKMDKKELEQNLYKAQQILNSSNIKKDSNKEE